MANGDLLSSIDAFLQRHSMSKSEFGVRAVNSSHLVSAMLAGRSPRPATLSRIRDFMREWEEAQAKADAAQLALVQRCGFVTVEADGIPRLESDTQLDLKCFRRLVASGALIASGDAMFGCPSQTYRAA